MVAGFGKSGKKPPSAEAVPAPASAAAPAAEPGASQPPTQPAPPMPPEPPIPPGDVAPPAPEATRPSPGTPTPEPPHRTRVSGLWVSLILAALVLILLLVFIIENSSRVDIAFLGFHGHLPLGVALLLAAVSGMLLLAIPGTGRILQLRRQVRRGRQAFIDEHVDSQ